MPDNDYAITRLMIENDMQKQLFRTTNLALGASLVAAKARLLGLERKSHRTIEFVFDSAADCERLAQQFADGHLGVDARTLCESMAMLKDRVFASLRENQYQDEVQRFRQNL